MIKSSASSVIVETQWAEDHLSDDSVRFVEVDVDTYSFEEGHLPGGIGWNWATELCDTVTRDILSPEAFAALMQRSGISHDTTVVLYGDNNNWFAAWAFWQMKIYNHADVRIMDGGRTKWIAEGRPLSHDVATPAPTDYKVEGSNTSLRSHLADVMKSVEANAIHLVDVRSPAEFSGELLAPPGLPETCQRGGHIPGAANIPWGKVCRDDGTFKSAEELRELYAAEGVDGSRPIVAYCRIGERSSHTWFALKYLVGYDAVTNYDGSWTEWGNLVGAPIEK